MTLNDEWALRKLIPMKDATLASFPKLENGFPFPWQKIAHYLLAHVVVDKFLSGKLLKIRPLSKTPDPPLIGH